jgi:hypothetical protein
MRVSPRALPAEVGGGGGGVDGVDGPTGACDSVAVPCAEALTPAVRPRLTGSDSEDGGRGGGSGAGGASPSFGPPGKRLRSGTSTSVGEITTDANTLAALRRELVHHLASGSKPRSGVSKAAAWVFHKAKQVEEAAVTAVLSEIADYRAPTGMEAGVYVLKDELWGEVDLFHPHLSTKHQLDAREVWLAKRKGAKVTTLPLHAAMTAARPVVPAPPRTWPTLVPLRRVLHTVAMAHTAKTALHDYVSHVEDAGKGRQHSNDAVVLGVLALLSLAAHTWPHTPRAAADVDVGAAAAAEEGAAVPEQHIDAFAAALSATCLVLPFGGPAADAPPAAADGASVAAHSAGGATAPPALPTAAGGAGGFFGGTSPPGVAKGGAPGRTGTRGKRGGGSGGGGRADSHEGADLTAAEAPVTLSAGELEARDAALRAAIRPQVTPSVVQLLYTLFKLPTAVEEVREGALWVLTQLRRLHPVTTAAVDAVLAADLDAAAAVERAAAEAARKAELEARKKAAQARALAAMANKGVRRSATRQCTHATSPRSPPPPPPRAEDGPRTSSVRGRGRRWQRQ